QRLRHFLNEKIGEEAACSAQLFAEGVGAQGSAEERGGTAGQRGGSVVRMIQRQTQDGVEEIAGRTTLMVVEGLQGPVEQAAAPPDRHGLSGWAGHPRGGKIRKIGTAGPEGTPAVQMTEGRIADRCLQVMAERALKRCLAHEPLL